MKRLLVLLAILLTRSTGARADANADVTQAFAAFIDGVAANKAPAVDTFIVPLGDHGDDTEHHPPVPDLEETRAMIASSKLKTAKVVVSKGGKSAWIAGEISGKRDPKKKAEPIRVSAFLAKDDKGWHVQATHWSTGEKDQRTEMCGMRDDWMPVVNIPKDTQAIVKSVFDSLETGFDQGITYDTAKFGKVMSDDKNAYVIGSAPKEVFIGGAKIKGVFKKWQIAAVKDSDDKQAARAAMGPDGEMMWIVMGVIAPPGLCVSYRTFMVLAKESGGWRIVHQHYSQKTNPFS